MAEGRAHLVKDIIKTGIFKNLFDDTKAVIVIKNQRRAYAHFKDKQKERYGRESHRLLLPAATRFHEAYLTFFSIQRNKAVLQETILVDDLSLHEDLIATVLNRYFLGNINFAVNFLNSIAEGTEILEADDAKLSHTVAIFMNIKCSVMAALDSDDSPLSVLDERKVENILKAMIPFAIKPVHLAAYIVDPNFCGRGLSGHEVLLAHEVVKTLPNFENWMKAR